MINIELHWISKEYTSTVSFMQGYTFCKILWSEGLRVRGKIQNGKDKRGITFKKRGKRT